MYQIYNNCYSLARVWAACDTGRSFQCFVEFSVCDYAGCNQPATGKRFEWRICTAIGSSKSKSMT